MLCAQDWLALRAARHRPARGGAAAHRQLYRAIRRRDFANMTSLVHLTSPEHHWPGGGGRALCGPARPPRPAPSTATGWQRSEGPAPGLGNLRT